MIQFYIGGGLANKMFQYAFSLAAKKYGAQVSYDLDTFKTEFAHDQVTLNSIFPNINIENHPCRFKMAGKQKKTYRLLKRLLSRYIIEHGYQYNEKALQQMTGNRYVEGSWQDERYFISSKEEVRRAFTFPQFIDKHNIDIANQIASCNSVAIHIRKGDGYGTWNIFGNTCPKEYYTKAIDYIQAHISNPKYFVFTDTPEMAAEYLDIDNYTLINWNPTSGKGNHYDMQLMSCAKHNIIANSTYSWWGAWLNANPKKIVIGPKYWFNPECKLANINHIIPENWIKL